MPGVHRNSDSRSCGASTTVTGQSTVYVNGLLVSVKDDPNTHGDGGLNASVNPGTIFVNGKEMVLQGSTAKPDLLCPVVGGPHCNPVAVGASGDVFGADGGGGGGSGGLANTDNVADPTGQDLYGQAEDVNSRSAEEEAEEETETRRDADENDPSRNLEAGETPATLSEREQTAYDYFVSQGYSPEEAAGIVGNLNRESRLDPTAVNPNDAGPGRDSEGVAQWNRDRLSNLQGFAAERGTNYQDFNTQLAFIDHELRGTGANGGGSESAAYNRLNGAATASDAAVAFSTYERYRGYELGIQGHETQQRAAEANRILAGNS